MNWFIFTAPDDALWWAKPLYNDQARPRKDGMAGIKIGVIPDGQTEITVETLVGGVSKPVKTTLGGLFVDGESVYQNTDTEYLMGYRDLLIAGSPPITADTAYHIIEDTNFPADHVCGITCEFRNAFEWDGTKTVVNMTKARVIHMDVIRAVRNAELVAKDIIFMRAVEAGDTGAQSTIGTEKQVLRDLPATFDLNTAATPEALKAKWPTELPARE
jgi:hypothetical protein